MDIFSQLSFPFYSGLWVMSRWKKKKLLTTTCGVKCDAVQIVYNSTKHAEHNTSILQALASMNTVNIFTKQKISVLEIYLRNYFKLIESAKPICP